jgi:LPS-assembly lipoprotein
MSSAESMIPKSGNRFSDKIMRTKMSRKLRFARLAVAMALAGLVAGCFQPLYGERSVTGGPAIREKLAAVEVLPINPVRGSNVARLGLEVRNALLFSFNGEGGALPPSYTLDVVLVPNRTNVIVDITTSRPDIENFGIDAVYTLKEVATGKTVLTGSTFSRVSYDIPGQAQRFARSRGLRDAEDRAAKVIADNISSRLASFFVTGS